jgi:hypothetical protein
MLAITNMHYSLVSNSHSSILVFPSVYVGRLFFRLREEASGPWVGLPPAPDAAPAPPVPALAVDADAPLPVVGFTAGIRGAGVVAVVAAWADTACWMAAIYGERSTEIVRERTVKNQT